MFKKLTKKAKNFVLFIKASYQNYKHRNKIKDKPVEGVFSYIYKSNYWGDKSSVSGVGSNDEQTRVIVEELGKVLKHYNIKNFLDLPCGDFNWMKKVDLKGIRYFGGDIVEDLVKNNQVNYGNENFHFQKLNVISDTLPKAELILCRDCFVHLSNEQVLASLNNIKKQNIRYLLTTSHSSRVSNKNIVAGEWRPINLEIAPFNLKAVDVINEQCTEDEGRNADKCLILVDMNQQNLPLSF